MSAKRKRFGVFRLKFFRQQLRPQQACGAQFCHLHEKIHAHRPEKRKPGRKYVDIHAGADAGFNIFQTICQRVGQFQISRRASLLHMVAGDRNRVEFRHVLAGIGKNISNDPHRRCGRINIGVAHHELFQNVILNGAGEVFLGNALFFSSNNIKRQNR